MHVRNAVNADGGHLCQQFNDSSRSATGKPIVAYLLHFEGIDQAERVVHIGLLFTKVIAVVHLLQLCQLLFITQTISFTQQFNIGPHHGGQFLF